MAKIAWGMGWSVSQAQGKMVRPTANMESAADHLRNKSLVFFWLKVLTTFFPTTLVPQWTGDQQGTQEQLISAIHERVDWYLFESTTTHTEGDVDGKVKVCDVPYCAVKLQARNIL